MRVPKHAMMFVVGSTRGPKVRAVRRFVTEFGDLISQDPIDVITQEVPSSVRETPIGREEIMSGARNRVRELLHRRQEYDRAYFVGLEGGFDIIRRLAPQAMSRLADQPLVRKGSPVDRRLVFLENWAYVSNGVVGYFGGGGSIAVPEDIAVEVVDRGRSLADVIDEFAGRKNIRSAEGTWGVLTAGRISREDVFYRALINAFAPFYSSTAPML